MQRILSRGEIENLDHTHIPPVRLPDPAGVFKHRAERLRQLAAGNPIADYLYLMAHLAEGQAQLFPLVVPGPSPERIDRAQAHGMPPLQALGWERAPSWQQGVFQLLKHVASAEGLDPAVAHTCTRLAGQLAASPDQLDAMADTLLARLETPIDALLAPFVMAALQVYWASLASRFNLNDLPVVSTPGVCPLCGSLPVASIVRVGKQIDGCRYLQCSLCTSEWHLVRVVCSHCNDTEKIAYHAIEGGPEGIKAESCDKCGAYRKIFYQEKQGGVDGVADDLATVALDILMGEEGYFRVNDNPLLWQERG